MISNFSTEMTPAEQTAFHEMRELPKQQDSDDWIMLDDVLDGSIPLDISHEGGELDGLGDDFQKTCASPLYYVHMSDFFSLRNIHRVDHRTRRDRTEKRNEAFNKQMPAIIDAYMDWSLQYADRDNPLPDPELSPDDGAWPVRVIDLFSECGYIGYFSLIE
jgi:hypothetical protein